MHLDRNWDIIHLCESNSDFTNDVLEYVMFKFCTRRAKYDEIKTLTQTLRIWIITFFFLTNKCILFLLLCI